jgi:hypothetical protein
LLLDPTITSLVWGSLRFIVIVSGRSYFLFDTTNERGQIARDIFDTFERLVELSDKVKDCLERFSLYIDIFDVTGLLGNRLTLFYQEIIIFCLKAADAYNQSRASRYLEGKDYTTDLHFEWQKP